MITQPIKPIPKKSLLGKLGVFFLFLSACLSLYAPFLASPDPFLLIDAGEIEFPFFNHLWVSSHYPFLLDRFLNVCAFLCPIALLFKSLRHLFSPLSRFFFIFILLLIGTFFFSPETKLRTSTHSSSLQLRLSPLVPYSAEQMVWKASLSSSWLNKTTPSGQNLMAKALFGLRYSYALALSSCFIAYILGSLWGLISGFLGGAVDQILCRALEIWDSMPTFLLILIVLEFTDHPSFLFKALFLACLTWSSIARIVRLDILKNKCLPFVDVLRNLEHGSFEIAFLHLFPCCFRSMKVLFPFALVGTVMYESALSFMGIGQLDRPSLGRLIEESTINYPLEPSLFWPPALFLLLGLVGLIFWGDALKKSHFDS